MLPRADGLRRTDLNGTTCLEGSDAVGHDAVLCPVTTTDHITGSDTGDGDMVLLTIVDGIEETATPRTDGNLCSTLTAGVRIIATHGFVFTIAPDLFTVLIALVGGNHHHDPDTVGDTSGLHDVDAAHDIRGVGLDRAFVTESDEGLGSEVEYDLRLVLRKDCLHLLTVADIGPEVGLDLLTDARKHVVVFVGIGIESYADDLCPHLMEPDAEPGALETGMAGDEDPSASEDAIETIFHHRLPFFPRSLTGLEQFFEHLTLTDIVHALPEALMDIGHQLPLIDQTVQGVFLEDGLITRYEVEDLGLKDHITGIDRCPVGEVLLTERLHSIIATDVEDALLLFHLHRRQGGQSAMTLVESEELVDIDIADAVAVGHEERFVAHILLDALDTATGHGM